ncbi:hypothetical protein LTR86_009786 [Recurvomyces mirabilis]|nr:hypothetical protein LTR86_009786 [Recurvomyces mirabilis]
MPIQILNLGLPRTGTQSLANALEILGYPKVYHMRTVDDTPGHRAKWVELMDAKFGSSHSQRPIQPKELQDLLKDYDACADFPASLFPIELATTYPGAKIIISTRPEDAWYTSMDSTLIYARNSRKVQEVQERHALSDRYNKYCWDDDFEANGRTYWREHMGMLKRYFEEQGRDVLWFEVGEGWERLCEFLGVEVPEVPWPNADDWKKYKVQRGFDGK